ncbi:MAG: hypothetical protein K2N07_01870, partial [Desulfovibrio sp.]|nr:hypothetical protein [Desulfovibrio sp.]
SFSKISSEVQPLGMKRRLSENPLKSAPEYGYRLLNCGPFGNKRDGFSIGYALKMPAGCVFAVWLLRFLDKVLGRC